MTETIRNPQEILRQINVVFAKLEQNEQENVAQLQRLSESGQGQAISSQLNAIREKEVLATEMIEQISQMLDHLGAQMTRQTVNHPINPDNYGLVH